MTIDLQKFCSRDIQKPNLCQPFNQGGFTNATNGHLIIRVPAIDGYKEQLVPNLAKLLPQFSEEPAEWFKCPVIKVAEPGVCPYCNGAKEGYVCPECDGEGEVELSTDFNYYDEEVCKSCDGSGQISESDLEKIKKRKPYLGLNPVKDICFHCEGTGVAGYDHKGVKVGGIPFSDLYLSWLCQLPNCEIGPLGEYLPARFRFDGGDGLIMPRRED